MPHVKSQGETLLYIPWNCSRSTTHHPAYTEECSTEPNGAASANCGCGAARIAAGRRHPSRALKRTLLAEHGKLMRDEQLQTS